ncbi:MAG: DUF4340 domain-containing protein [Clostridiales Family XIII bacterium]|jgi:hypothetical protein|nr:DUF4340 domain-containing protein [Clostridiales Family XIII bacterium]
MIWTKRNAFLLAGIALALLVAYVALLALRAQSSGVAGARSAARSQLPAVWELPLEKIARIVVEPLGEDSLVFERGEAFEWVLASPPGLRYDAEIAAGVAPNAALLVPEKEIGSLADGAERYGLDAPVTVIRIFLGEETDETAGGEYDILLGDATSTGDARYFAVSGDDRVFSMRAEKASSLMIDRLNALDRNALGFNRGLRPAAIAESIANISVNGVAAEDGRALARTLAGLNALAFFDASDLSRYGLDAPRLTIRFENEYGAHAIFIGNAASAEEAYARVEGWDAVFTVPSRGFESLTISR